jgi:hypothetical protein
MGRNAYNNDEILKSLATSLVVCVPVLLSSLYIIKSHIVFPAPTLMMAAVLGVGVVNFGLTVALEYVRRKIGKLTLPAILGMAGVVFLFVVAESINRFVRDVNFHMLLPVVGVFFLLSLLAIFREKTLVLKLYLAFNALALAVLWGLGSTGKIWLPF